MASHSAKRHALHFPEPSRVPLEPYLPLSDVPTASRPFTTLTFATSLDSSLSLAPGTQTALSGTQSKAMTHYLRSRHDAILIGVGTALADNPSLNCRIEGVGGYGGEGLLGQPRPVIIDPTCKWPILEESTKVLALARDGRGKAPYVVCTQQPEQGAKDLLERHGGKYITLSSENLHTGPASTALDWHHILETLALHDIKSVMIEGGGKVINTLLAPRNADLIDSVIVTIAPVWLGQGGVVVSPERRTENEQAIPAARLKNVRWLPLGDDVVLCGRL